ncbi:MAG: molybdopterin-guanine dinucleotide biosynthesis protein MobB [Eubacteriales bacterium]|nr:molybdopterin-guanine dinucleotide biosynthesis protein MobB [Eubacteriales bacterium]MDD3073707.1 molybdopterin-guanine dinucleotide biosynthesis protein MobB [Eubacteriales bacterium]MDD4078917.1 molybdopterin-guanine dinucleotide biosynthesis protein MobB [Eubacteriales bacterium]MDD4769224.1 molybdopterin-guanine dinucleotide biosynthesis protein MobB [Eubacteriales bacterium]
MKVFSVIGITQSGKTNTVEKIIGELSRRRYSVGSVKDIHFEAFAIDTPGTNTYRHRQAGASLVTARGLKETDILYPLSLPIEKILEFYDQDWVVLEGVREINAPKIICAHDEEGIEDLLDASAIAIAGQVANTGLKEYKGLPVFNALTQAVELTDYVVAKVPRRLPDFDAKCCGLCGMSCRELLAEIIRGEKKRVDCLLRQTVQLKIGGKPVTMVPFVQEILTNALTALVSTLDGYEQGKEISLVWNPGD